MTFCLLPVCPITKNGINIPNQYNISIAARYSNFAEIIHDLFFSTLAVAHHIYGIPHTINTANYVYFLGLQKALSLNHPDVTRVFTGRHYVKRLSVKS